MFRYYHKRAIFCLFLLCLLFPNVIIINAHNYLFLSEPFGLPPQGTDINMQVAGIRLNETDLLATVVITNNTNYNFVTTRDFHLEFFDGEDWNRVPFFECFEIEEIVLVDGRPMVFDGERWRRVFTNAENLDAILNSIEICSHGYVEIEKQLNYFPTLEQGLYRIRKQISFQRQNDKNSHTHSEHFQELQTSIFRYDMIAEFYWNKQHAYILQ